MYHSPAPSVSFFYLLPILFEPFILLQPALWQAPHAPQFPPQELFPERLSRIMLRTTRPTTKINTNPVRIVPTLFNKKENIQTAPFHFPFCPLTENGFFYG
jgi:hypothetical protein